MGNPSVSGGQSLWEESVSAVTATNSVELGARRYENGVDWVYCYNGSSNEQITTGRGAKIASGSTGYTLDVAIVAHTTESASVCFGVCVNATLTTGTYGWVAQRGFAGLENFGATSIAAGDHIHLHTSGAFTQTTYTTGLHLKAGVVGIACAAQATTTTGSFTAYINLPA